jgi:Protein of unknown function (DUF2924)
MARPQRSRGAGNSSAPLGTASSERAPIGAIEDLATLISGLAELDQDGLRLQWRNHLGGAAPDRWPLSLVLRMLAFRIQAARYGDLDKATSRLLRTSDEVGEGIGASVPFAPRSPTTREGANLRAGALLVREWNGRSERVVILDKGFAWNGKTYGSLSQVAKAITGTVWNGHRFFGLRNTRQPVTGQAKAPIETKKASRRSRRAGHDPEFSSKHPTLRDLHPRLH